MAFQSSVWVIRFWNLGRSWIGTHENTPVQHLAQTLIFVGEINCLAELPDWFADTQWSQSQANVFWTPFEKNIWRCTSSRSNFIGDSDWGENFWPQFSVGRNKLTNRHFKEKKPKKHGSNHAEKHISASTPVADHHGKPFWKEQRKIERWNDCHPRFRIAAIKPTPTIDSKKKKPLRFWRGFYYLSVIYRLITRSVLATPSWFTITL